MIIKGGQAGNVGWWAQHLQRDDTNERAQVMEIKGLLSTDLRGALREMEAIAAQSRSGGNFMYQANINPRDHEHLTPEQWAEAVDALEKKLGFEGHQRVVVEHEKEGRTHRHVIWNRVDVDTLRVADITGNYRKHDAVARDLENRFDLSPTPSPSREQKPERAPELWEIRAAERSGITPEAVKEQVTALWRTTDSGQAFAAALDGAGFVLAKGDRRDFCIIDQAGDVHSLARRIEGAKVADLRDRMADIDRDTLPTVAEARAQQRTAHADRQHDQTAQRVEAAQEQAQKQPQPTAQHAQENQPEARAAQSKEEKSQRAIDAGIQATRQREAAQQEAWKERRDEQVARAEQRTPASSKAGLRVAGGAMGVASGLADFVGGLLGSKPTKEQAEITQRERNRRAMAALENIRHDIEAGRDLSPADVRHLTPTHLQNIAAKGDAYILQIVQQMEEERERGRDYGRARER